MNKLLIASGNQHKITEIKSMLKTVPNLTIRSLKDFGISIEVDEDGDTLRDNAFKKAKEYSEFFEMPALSDDTGLFVDALNGEPGVFSSRYSGENATYDDNKKKLLNSLKNVPEERRTAEFRSVICYYVDPKEYYFFEGICKGKIIFEERGENGFGYDAVFVPDNFKKTFAELTESEKNKISHRAIALLKFREFSEIYFQENRSH